MHAIGVQYANAGGISPPLLLEVGFFKQLQAPRHRRESPAIHSPGTPILLFCVLAVSAPCDNGRNPTGHWRKATKFPPYEDGASIIATLNSLSGLTPVSPPVGVPFTSRPSEIAQPFGDIQVQSNAMCRVQEHLRRTYNIQFIRNSVTPWPECISHYPGD